MKPTPPDWPRVSTALFYQEAARAIDWLCNAFGFEVRLKVEGDGGRIEHSELTYGDGLIMVGEASREKFPWRRSPRAIGGANTQALMVYVDDVEAHCRRAREAGAKITVEPETHDYGGDYWTDRSYEAEDLEGHHWWFTQRLRNPQKT
jgi:uncharacterized glyoxalase superfamily protein PhnB